MDLNPQIFDAISENPAIIEALSKYGNKIDEFINRYRLYRSNKAGDSKMSKTKTEAAEVVDVAVEELEAADTPEVVDETPETPEAPESVEETPAEEAEAEEVAESAESESEESAGEVESTEQPESEGLSREQFVAVADEFGDAVAVQIMRDGGTVEDAARIAYKAAQKEIEQLRKGSLKSGGAPAPTTEVKESKPLIRISGRSK